MKIFLKDGSVLLQRRDIDYLANMGVLAFVKLSVEEERKMKEAKKKNPGITFDARDFVRVDDSLLVDFLEVDETVVNFFDYLTMQTDQLRDLVDDAEQAHFLLSTSYDQLGQQYLEQARYRHEILEDMYYNKYSQKILDRIPIEEDPAEYDEKFNGFNAVATNVSNIYLLHQLKDNPLLMNDSDLQDYFRQAREYFASTMSKTYGNYIHPKHLSLMISADEEKGHVMIKR